MQSNKESGLFHFWLHTGQKGVEQEDPDLYSADSLEALTGQPLLPSLGLSAPSQVLRR